MIVPTKGRETYLRVALESLVRQDWPIADFEILVVDDAHRRETEAVVDKVRQEGGPAIAYVPRQGEPGLNSGRNTGIASASGNLLVLVDDDIHAPVGWLRALIEGARRHPGAVAFGGPIELRLEASRLRMCGREQPPITTLDGGLADREIELVWGANMAFDRRALELAGEFDPGVPYGFDEDMWERRLRERGGSIFYIADAGLIHRRDPDDARLRSLMRESYKRGRNLRAYSEHRGEPPSLAAELRILTGCFVHIFRYRCGNGILLTAHSAGRVRTALARGRA